MSARLSRLGKRTFAILAAAGLAAPEAARAGGFRVFESTAVLGRSAAGRAPEEFTLAGCCDGVLDEGHGPGSFRLDLRFPPTLSLDTDSGGLLGPPRLQPLRPEPRRFFITIASVGAVAGSALNSFTDGPHGDFHFTNEGYFGRQHLRRGRRQGLAHRLVLRRLPAPGFRLRGLRPFGGEVLHARLRRLGPDGFRDGARRRHDRYGFSHEDLVADSLGALSAYVLAHYGLNDLIGFRAGVFSSPDTPEEFRSPVSERTIRVRSTRPI